MNWNGMQDLSVVLQFLRFYLVNGFKWESDRGIVEWLERNENIAAMCIPSNSHSSLWDVQEIGSEFSDSHCSESIQQLSNVNC